jgi:PAS domain S-box-containing protein
MNKSKILIVENQQQSREEWISILKNDPAFLIVGVCDTVDKVIEKAAQFHPDIIIINVNLPGMNGLEVISQIRKYNPESKILFSNCNEIYHSLFEHFSDGIIVADLTGHLLDVNMGLAAMTGFSKAELLKLNINDLISSTDIAAQAIGFDQLALGEHAFYQLKLLNKSGVVICVKLNAKKITAQRVLIIVHNITEEKNAEQVLQKSEANLHTIFDTSDTMYVLIDKNFRIISYNPRALAFAGKELGYSPEIGQAFLDYFPAEKKHKLLLQMKEILAGKHMNYEVSYPQEKGMPNWYYVRMFPISKGNTIYGLMVEVSDITQIKLLEEKILVQNVAEQKNITRAVLHAQEIERNRIGQELHDNVNQILSTIKLYITLMEQDSHMRETLSERTKEYIDTAIKELRMLSMKQVTPPKKIDLKEWIEELTRDLNENSVADTKFHCNVKGHLLISDDLKLNIYRIIQEQINNILKYANASRADIEINDENGNVNIIILDNGQGFDPFLKRKGIGISNMINRVESYNGKIIIESSPGMGCKIDISIPE